MNSCILLSAGVGERFGGEQPKQFSIFHGLPLYKYTLGRIEAMTFIDEIILVVHPEYMDVMGDCLSSKTSIVAGGRSRQESVKMGLDAVKGDRIMIHEVVRPLITESQALMGFDAVRYSQGASFYTDLVETLVMDEDGEISSTLNRNLYKTLQCPQFFQTEVLRNAHEQFKDRTFTDDTRLIKEYGGKVKLLKGGPNLTKVTTHDDLLFLNCL